MTISQNFLVSNQLCDSKQSDLKKNVVAICDSIPNQRSVRVSRSLAHSACSSSPCPPLRLYSEVIHF